MAANMPFLRPLAIAAGLLGCLQAIIWAIFALLGILVFTGDIKPDLSQIASNQFQIVLLRMYFIPSGVGLGTMFPWADKHSLPMTSGTVAVWTSIYFVTSLIWLGISVFLLYDSYLSKFTSNIIIGWVAVSAVVAVIDFAGIIAFGADYSGLKRILDSRRLATPCATDFLLAPIFMMMMCARGFILWIINIGLVVHLGGATRKLKKQDAARNEKVVTEAEMMLN